RSIPLEKASDDAMIAYGQNGEALRPEQGYPARLLVPGWEGNANVKWILRIEIADRPFMTREETSKYSDPLPDCTARLFSFAMDAKSVITFPAYPVTLPDKGWWEIEGLAWSGRGRVRRVDVSTDAGRHWAAARKRRGVSGCRHLRPQVRRLSWEDRDRGAVRPTRGPRAARALPVRARPEAREDDRQLLALRDHAVRLYQPRHAARRPRLPQAQRGVQSGGVSAIAERDHRGYRSHERGNPATRGHAGTRPIRHGYSSRRPGNPLARMLHLLPWRGRLLVSACCMLVSCRSHRADR